VNWQTFGVEVIVLILKVHQLPLRKIPILNSGMTSFSTLSYIAVILSYLNLITEIPKAK
jgi:hypothetical protein